MRFDPLPAADCLIDSHCHLDAPELAPDVDGVVARARAAGVGQLLVPAVTAGAFADVLAMRERYGCWIAFGLHPIYLDRHLDEHLDLLDAALAAHRSPSAKSAWISTCLPSIPPGRKRCWSSN